MAPAHATATAAAVVVLTVLKSAIKPGTVYLVAANGGVPVPGLVSEDIQVGTLLIGQLNVVCMWPADDALGS